MKKIVTAAALATAVAGMATADITFGSWGRGLWITAANDYDAANDKTTIVQDVHQSWGGNAPRTALGVSGDSDNVGFKLDIHGNATNLGVGDNAYIWAKPIDQVKLYVGQTDVNALRGDAAFGLWNWDRIGCVDKRQGGEGWTFPAFVKNSGVSIEITPMDGLVVIADVPLNLDGTAKKFSNAYGHGAKYGLGYELPNVGTIKFGLETKPRVQKIKKDGNTYKLDDATNYVQIDAAFDLKSVENAFFSLGVRVPTVMGAYVEEGKTLSSAADAASNAAMVTGYGRYSIDALTAHFIFGVSINGADKKADDVKLDGAVGFSLGAGVDYSLAEFAEGVGVFADVRYASGLWVADTSADKNDTVTFGLGVEKGWSNGKIGIAFEGTTHASSNNFGRYNYKDADAFAFEVPVKVEYWF